MDGWIKFLTSIVDTVNTKAKQYQECETLAYAYHENRSQNYEIKKGKG